MPSHPGVQQGTPLPAPQPAGQGTQVLLQDEELSDLLNSLPVWLDPLSVVIFQAVALLESLLVGRPDDGTAACRFLR